MTFPPRAISRRECFSFLSRLITETFRKIHALLEERRNSFGFNAPYLRELAPSGASIEQHASLEKRARSLTDVQSEIAAKFYWSLEDSREARRVKSGREFRSTPEQ